MSDGVGTPERWESGGRPAEEPLFDEDAEAYDRTRPVASGAVFDDVLRLAGLSAGARVLEIGPGTGQATRPLAERGLRVLALEPGPRLAALATRNLSAWPQVEVRCTTVEGWDPGGERFDAVLACNSFHWVDPGVRVGLAASVLRDIGSLVVLNTPVVVPDGADTFWSEVQDDWAAVGAERVDPAVKHPALVGDLGAEVRASGLFAEPAVLRRRFDVVLTAEEYATNLGTQTAVKRLPPPAREELLAQVRRRIRARGGRLTVHHLAVATVARRLP